MTAGVEIRPAGDTELPLLAEIDEQHDLLYQTAGLQLPGHAPSLRELREAKAVFVHGHPPVGFIWVTEADGLAHIEQMAVRPDSMGHGVGTALVETACSWAAAQGYHAITLTTYADVAWNGPFYATRGFVESDEITPDLAERRDWEYSVGLDALGRRIVMRRDLAA